MFKNLLKKRGYILRKDVRHLELNEDELLPLILNSFGGMDMVDISIDTDEEKRIFEELSAIDGLQEYLRRTMAQDMKRHFNVQPVQQLLIRGAFQRTAFFRKKLRERDKENKKEGKKLTTSRHL